MKPINHFCSVIPAELATKMNQLSELNRLWETLGGENALYSEIANYVNGQLTFLVKNSAWATRIRFRSPELIKQLQTQAEFKMLRKILCKVASPGGRGPLLGKEEDSSTRYSLSHTTAGVIMETALNIRNANLKAALLKLIPSPPTKVGGEG